MWKLYEHPKEVRKALVVKEDGTEVEVEHTENPYWEIKDEETNMYICDKDNVSVPYRWYVMNMAISRCDELNKRDYAKQ